MQESKYQIKNWKKWKATKYLLVQTKNELMNNIKAITYTNELPGGSHKSIADKYNKLIEDVKVYDDYIKAYDVLINRLENAVAELLNEEERELVIIYSNHPFKGDSKFREEEALKAGYSRTNYYNKISEVFNILDTVLDTDKGIEYLKSFINIK